MTNTLRSLDPPINTVPDGGPYAGRHQLLNSTVVVQPRVSGSATCCCCSSTECWVMAGWRCGLPLSCTAPRAAPLLDKSMMRRP